MIEPCGIFLLSYGGIMAENIFYSIKDLSKEQNLAIAYYFYTNYCDLINFYEIDETQDLYNALVSALGLEEQSRKVLEAILREHKQNKLLTTTEKKNHPFDYQGQITHNYKEDSIIYDRCGQWDSTTLENINLIRAVFADKTCDFSRIIAYTFFYILDDKKKTLTIPEKIEVPESIVINVQSYIEKYKDIFAADSSNKKEKVKFIKRKNSYEAYIFLYNYYTRYENNPKQAFHWLKKASYYKVPSDLRKLSDCYKNGKGCEKSAIYAQKIYSIYHELTHHINLF